MPEKGPTWSEITPGGNSIVERDCGGYIRKNEAANGRSTVTMKCPFCHTEVIAYVWSLAGAGKRCSCGALVGSAGVFYHFADR